MELSRECSTDAQDDGWCSRENLGRKPLAPPQYIRLPPQAVTMTPPPTLPQLLVIMADQTKYYELYRRSRYCMRILGADWECTG